MWASLGKWWGLCCKNLGDCIRKHSLLIFWVVLSRVSAYMTICWQTRFQSNPEWPCVLRLLQDLILKYYRNVLLTKKKKVVVFLRVCACVCSDVEHYEMWVRSTRLHNWEKEGHNLTYQNSVIEYGRPYVMLKSVRSPSLTSLSVCPAWNFCLILRWGEETVINTLQYLQCPLVLRESFTTSLLRSYVNQNVHQKPFATLATACKYMCTCKQPWQA